MLCCGARLRGRAHTRASRRAAKAGGTTSASRCCMRASAAARRASWSELSTGPSRALHSHWSIRRSSCSSGVTAALRRSSMAGPSHSTSCREIPLLKEVVAIPGAGLWLTGMVGQIRGDAPLRIGASPRPSLLPGTESSQSHDDERKVQTSETLDADRDDSEAFGSTWAVGLTLSLPHPSSGIMGFRRWSAGRPASSVLGRRAAPASPALRAGAAPVQRAGSARSKGGCGAPICSPSTAIFRMNRGLRSMSGQRSLRSL